MSREEERWVRCNGYYRHREVRKVAIIRWWPKKGVSSSGHPSRRMLQRTCLSKLSRSKVIPTCPVQRMRRSILKQTNEAPRNCEAQKCSHDGQSVNGFHIWGQGTTGLTCDDRGVAKWPDLLGCWWSLQELQTTTYDHLNWPPTVA